MTQDGIIGVVIVTYSSADVILQCLDSLSRSENVGLRIVICDNASPDDTCATICAWAKEKGISFLEAQASERDRSSRSYLTLLRSPRNLGYAGGVNLGLEYLREDPGVDFFWILNPDCTVRPNSAFEFAKAAKASAPFSLMGGRIYYSGAGEDDTIQSDGGNVSLWTGVCRNLNQGQTSDKAQHIRPEQRNFISGANMVVSRTFLEEVGLMPEDYFLYYEEVDWAQRRGRLPLAWCSEACVFHQVGTVIGSGTVNRAASPFSNYFNFRNRMIFIARHNPWALPMAYGYTALKVLKVLLTVGSAEAAGGWRGLNFLSPPKEVASLISPEARPLSFRRIRGAAR